jgi:tetratricopeptide (TPR) repeat protein
VLAFAYVQMRDNTKALEYYHNWYEQVSKEGINSFWGFTAYNSYGISLIKEGQVEKGKEMLQKQIDFFSILLQGKRSVFTPQIYYEFFILYATLGEFDKAYINLKKFEETEEGWSLYGDFVSWAKADARIDLMRNDLVFNASLERGEMKIQAIQKEIFPYLTTELLE